MPSILQDNLFQIAIYEMECFGLNLTYDIKNLGLTLSSKQIFIVGRRALGHEVHWRVPAWQTARMPGQETENVEDMFQLFLRGTAWKSNLQGERLSKWRLKKVKSNSLENKQANECYWKFPTVSQNGCMGSISTIMVPKCVRFFSFLIVVE